METPAEKHCSKCLERKALSEFASDRSHNDGLSVQCRACRKAAKANRNPAIPEKKLCKACGEIKSASEFWKEKTSADGLQYVCKPCKKTDRLRIQQTKPPNCKCRVCGIEFYRPLSQKARGDAFCSEACQQEEQRLNRLKPKPKRKRSDNERTASKAQHARYAEANRLNPPDPLTLKRCKTCNEWKPLQQFTLNTSNKDGHGAHCKDCHAHHVKNLRASNPQYAFTAHTYYLVNKPVIQLRTARYREENPEKIQKQRRKRLKLHREQIRGHTQKRRARIKNAPFIEAINLEVLAIRDNWICHICQKKVTRKTWSADHLIPVVAGGETSYLNVALAHKRCNSKRGPGRLPAQLRLLP